jgi:hypothetical protein
MRKAVLPYPLTDASPPSPLRRRVAPPLTESAEGIDLVTARTRPEAIGAAMKEPLPKLK